LASTKPAIAAHKLDAGALSKTRKEPVQACT
jgi:hypothetical protein